MRCIMVEKVKQITEITALEGEDDNKTRESGFSYKFDDRDEEERKSRKKMSITS